MSNASSSNPISYFAEQIPAAFARGMTLLEERHPNHVDDAKAASGAVRLVSEGGEEVFFAVSDGAMRVSETAPEGVRIRFAVAVPNDALSAAVEELSQADVDEDEAALRMVRMASKKLESILEAHVLRFHVVVTDVPDLGDVTVRAALHDDAPPETPGFSATIAYDDLERVREGSLNPQALMMGGKLRFAGDYGPALQLGMQLMQLMQ